MFAPLVAICVLGGECTLFTRTDNKMYKTHEECYVATVEDVKQLSELLEKREIKATIGFKCEVPKDRV